MVLLLVTIVAFVLLISVVLVLRHSKVSAMKKTDKDLNRFKTYAFLPESSIHWPDLEKEGTTDVSELVVDTVNKNMQQLGYRLDLDDPDLLVILKTGKVHSNRPIYASFPYSATQPMHPVYSAYSYKGYQMFNDIVGRQDVGNNSIWLRIDVVERKTKEILWTASSNDAVYVKKTSEEIASYLNEMFEAYPTHNSHKK